MPKKVVIAKSDSDVPARRSDLSNPDLLNRFGTQAWQSHKTPLLRPEHHAVQGFVCNDTSIRATYRSFTMVCKMLKGLLLPAPFCALTNIRLKSQRRIVPFLTSTPTKLQFSKAESGKDYWLKVSKQKKAKRQGVDAEPIA